MRRVSSLLLVTTCLVAGGAATPASASQAACTFQDTSFTNTAYTEGPGTKSTGGSGSGPLSASLSIASSEPSTAWGKATDRINGAHHILTEGTWTVTFEYGTGRGHVDTNGSPSYVARVGYQLEQFTGNPDVFLTGESYDMPVVPNDADYTSAPGTAPGIQLEVAPGRTADLDALFFIDAHASRNQGTSVHVSVTWSGVSICWRKSTTATPYHSIISIIG